MNPRELFRRVSSVSAAISMLFAGKAEGNTGNPTLPKIEGGNDDSFKPIVINPPAPREMDSMQFAGHSSHASHSSHYSGSGSSGSGSGSSSGYGTYTTPTPTVTPLPTSTPIPTPRPTPFPTPRPTITPTPTPIPQASAAPFVSLEFKNGAIFYGQVLVKSPAGITFQTLNKVQKIPRELLTEKTITKLGLGPAP